MGGSIILEFLSAKQSEDGVAQSEEAADGGGHGKSNESAEADPQKI